MALAGVNGSRLAFVVMPLRGELEREHVRINTKEIGKSANGNPRLAHTMERYLKKEPAGFMAYFPRGHAIRIKSKADLAKYGLDKQASIINVEGLNDPNSPLGKLVQAQDQEARNGAFLDMQKAVMAMATRKSGSVLLPEQTASPLVKDEKGK